MNGPEIILVGIFIIVLGGVAIALIQRKKAGTLDAAKLQADVLEHVRVIAKTLGTEFAGFLKEHVAQLERLIEERLNRAQATPAAPPAPPAPQPVAEPPAAPIPAVPEPVAAPAPEPPTAIVHVDASAGVAVADSQQLVDAVKAAVVKALADRLTITFK